MEQKEQAVFIIVEYLNQLAKSSTFEKDQIEALENSRDWISAAFQFDLRDAETRKKYLTSDFDLKAAVEAVAAAKTKTLSVSKEDQEKAEALKKVGNAKLAEKKYTEAIDNYTQALALDPSNVVYYSNRAAAYSFSGEHEKSLEDARKAIEIDENYSKGWGRLGHAAYCLGKYDEAAEAYKKGIALEPENKSFKQSLETTTKKLEKMSVAAPESATSGSASPAAATGMPNFGAGGMPNMGDMASMMSDPNFMNMANSLMSDPNFAQMASRLMGNPGLMNQFSGMFGGAAPGSNADK